jgi:hypothetical protein
VAAVEKALEEIQPIGWIHGLNKLESGEWVVRYLPLKGGEIEEKNIGKVQD